MGMTNRQIGEYLFVDSDANDIMVVDREVRVSAGEVLGMLAKYRDVAPVQDAWPGLSLAAVEEAICLASRCLYDRLNMAGQAAGQPALAVSPTKPERLDPAVVRVPPPAQQRRGPKVINTPLDAISYQIIGTAMAVHRQRGPGLRENTYQRELELQLAHVGLEFEPQKMLEVYDSAQEGVLVGYYIPDLIVSTQVVVELKALKNIDASHQAQVIGYLAVTKCPLGLLINFGARSLQWKRIFPPRNVTEHQVNRQWLFVPDWLKPPP
jgi:GxxExxY protein